jgi:hypothetical protein
MCKMKGTGLLTLTTQSRRLQLTQEATSYCASMLPRTQKLRLPSAESGSELSQGGLHLDTAVLGFVAMPGDAPVS